MSVPEARLNAMADQLWMEWETKHLEAIERLAETGLPASQSDVQTIRCVLCGVLANIYQRQAFREDG